MAGFRRKLGGLLSACAALVLFVHCAQAQIYPFPPTSGIYPVLGPAPTATVSGNIVTWTTPLNSQPTAADSGVSLSSLTGLVSPAITVCPSNAFVTGFPASNAQLTCRQPNTTDLSNISSFSLVTSGSVQGSAVATNSTVSFFDTVVPGSIWSLSVSNGQLNINNGLSTVAYIDINGIPSFPTVQDNFINTLGLTLGKTLPMGAHTVVQEWFEIKNPSGVIRYVPGF